VPRKADIPADVFFDEPPRKREGGGEDSKGLKQQNAKSAEGDGAAERRRVGRPPMQEGPKEPVTLYLTEPAAHRLEEARYVLLTEYGVKTSKSALADYAVRSGLGDLAAVAEALGEQR